ncbi:uncharacterized protein LOC130976982 isoform X2 [Arachis stenosperma]|uniref:uncharacterized protein LOC130976982 isoform X2 n=1 Tax=Arachis stenosperma TaxID=217475 RepID=UPI0025ABAFD8|nr:uncharacterized protein LOC130976982 isoform X2 [Arachis stenosperma]
MHPTKRSVIKPLFVAGGERVASKQVSRFGLQARQHQSHRTEMLPSRSQNCFPELQPSLSHFSNPQPRSQIRFPLPNVQNEVDELEELREKRDRFYEAKMVEMKQFKEVADEFVVKCRRDVQGLRNRVNELRSSFIELKGNNQNSCNSEIAMAEKRRLELQAEKECVYRNLASNQQIKAQLQKQLQNILIKQTREKRK